MCSQELIDKKYRDESALRELRGKLNVVEEENTRNKHDFLQLRQNNTALDSDHHEQEKLMNQVVKLKCSQSNVD